MDNIILTTDSYKLSHWHQYPPGTNKVESYFESRGGEYNSTIFSGLQGIIKKYLVGQVVTKDMIEEAKQVAKLHFGREDCFNEKMWMHILTQHGGRLPIKIKAVREGTNVPTSNVLMTVVNTDPKCFSLTNHLETLLVQVWYPTTVATNSHIMKNIFLHYLEKNGDPSLIDYKVHDFGGRGVSSMETAEIGGTAHLTSFKGTDTLPAIMYARKYYGSEMAGNSIPASEHSTITAWGKDNEVKACRNMLDKYPTGVIACVSDSFDIFNACTNIWGNALKNQVMARDGILVVRPDSGHPITDITLKVYECLEKAFGSTNNAKGFHVLDPHIRMIQGDGIGRKSMTEVLDNFDRHGISADNITVGSGGKLLQDFNRDTCKFAFKCSYMEANGIGRDVYKDPVTDKGKISKMGRLSLVRQDGMLKTVPYLGDEFPDDDLLETVFEDGVLKREQSLEEIRQIVNNVEPVMA